MAWVFGDSDPARKMGTSRRPWVERACLSGDQRQDARKTSEVRVPRGCWPRAPLRREWRGGLPACVQSRPGRARGELGDRWLQLDMSVSTRHSEKSVGSGCLLNAGAAERPSRLDVGCKGGDD